MTETKVDPGDLDDFSKRVHEIAEYWASKDGSAGLLMTNKDNDYGFPMFGDFSEGVDARDAYVTARKTISENFNELKTLLDGLSDASKKIGENYRNTQALNKASAQQIDAILAEEMGTKPGADPTKPPA